jgi:transcriptional regulator with XRE-family HTH domain
MHLLQKDSRLMGEEVRFLRKAVGYSATELARMAGTSKTVVSRWENRSTLSQENDRLVRLICANKILADCLLGAAQGHLREHLVSKAQEVVASMDNTLKKMKNTKTAKAKQYTIDPAELAKLSESFIENPADGTRVHLQ